MFNRQTQSYIFNICIYQPFEKIIKLLFKLRNFFYAVKLQIILAWSQSQIPIYYVINYYISLLLLTTMHCMHVIITHYSLPKLIPSKDFLALIESYGHGGRY